MYNNLCQNLYFMHLFLKVKNELVKNMCVSQQVLLADKRKLMCHGVTALIYGKFQGITGQRQMCDRIQNVELFV